MSTRTLVLGLGNPILRDDGVGWRVVDEVERRVCADEVECDKVALGGLALMERLVGYKRAILVDAVQTEGGSAGTVRRLTLEDLPSLHSDAIHDASLRASLELGRRLGAALPDDIRIVGIEAREVLTFGETLTPEVEAAVPVAAAMVMAELSWRREEENMVSPELLRRHRFFAGLREEELAGIAMIAEECGFPQDAIVFREGERAAHFYILISGGVDLIYEIHHAGGVDTSYVGSIPAGEPFGISAFVEPYVFSATAKAHGAIKTIAVDAAALRALSEVDCHLGYSIMRQVAVALAERLTFARVQLAACG